MAQTRREETEAAILTAARARFSRKGFEQVGVRDIADAAGVNAALVIRYFGSKEDLFEQAVTQEVDLDELFRLPRGQLGEMLVRYIVGKK
jgi:AcrR family transcriptional regulator